jgi:branched-chain amino acid transport system substrate-binding protein
MGAALGLVALAAAGCDNKSNAANVGPEPKPGPGTSASAAEWKIGSFLSLSGPDAQFGTDTKEGIELAVDEVNKAGGEKGKPLKVLFEDDKSNPQEASNKVLQLIDRDKVVALLGEVASSRAKAGGIVANKKKIPMVSPSATNPDVTKVGPFIFRVCFTDEGQGQAAAIFAAKTLNKKKVAILFASDDLYSSGISKFFREEAQKLGLEVVAEKGFLHTETNFTTYLTELRDAKPDLIYAPVYYSVMVPIARQAKAAGMKGDMFIGGDGWDSFALLDGAGAELEGAYYTDHMAPDIPWPSSQAFIKAYKERYKHDPAANAAMGYDAAKLLADAIGRAKGDSPESIRDAIAETKGFQGASGSITINAERNADKPIVIVQVKDKKFVYHSTVNPSETK